MAEKNEEGTKEKILAAAIDIIESQGIKAATARAISAEANVNLAAINYHYRTKDALMAAAMAASWRHALEDLRGFLDAAPWKPRLALNEIGCFLRLGALRYPTITRLHFLGTKESGIPESALASFQAGSTFWDFVTECGNQVAAFLGIEPDWAFRCRTEAFFAATVCPALIPGGISTSSERRSEEEFVALLVEDYLSAIARRPEPMEAR